MMNAAAGLFARFPQNRESIDSMLIAIIRRAVVFPQKHAVEVSRDHESANAVEITLSWERAVFEALGLAVPAKTTVKYHFNMPVEDFRQVRSVEAGASVG